MLWVLKRDGSFEHPKQRFKVIYKEIFTLKYLHFKIKPLMNLQIFATVNSLMKDINLIHSCQAHLPVQYASYNKFIRQK